jgi:hypothetical protein
MGSSLLFGFSQHLHPVHIRIHSAGFHRIADVPEHQARLSFIIREEIGLPLGDLS